MKKIINKFKKYTFWVAFVGVLVYFLQNLANLIGCDLDTTNIESAIMSFCGVLVVLGVVTKDDDKQSTSQNTTKVEPAEQVETPKTGEDELTEIVVPVASASNTTNNDELFLSSKDCEQIVDESAKQIVLQDVVNEENVPKQNVFALLGHSVSDLDQQNEEVVESIKPFSEDNTDTATESCVSCAVQNCGSCSAVCCDQNATCADEDINDGQEKTEEKSFDPTYSRINQE